MTHDSITLQGMYNVRAAVYNYTVVRTADYEFPSAAQLKEGEPKSVLRHTAFAMEWSSLRNATEYAVSIYAEDHKGVASDQAVASTTFFITTDAIRCAAADGWDSAMGGTWARQACELGFRGEVRRWCDGEGVWGETVSDCGGRGVGA